MKANTKSAIRVKKARKQFKSHYGETIRHMNLEVMLNEEEACFKVEGDTKVSYMVFHENDLLTFADSMDYFIEDYEGGKS